ncbi:hypothetical protein [Bacillus mobilis]|uniref:hypothetical protein n=1 Tax=Bacillus mobilis TaxID=2026190 RepID=UPI0036433A34
MRKHLAALGATALLLAGCSAPSTPISSQPASAAPSSVAAVSSIASTPSETPTATPTPAPTKAADAASIAASLKPKVASITKVTTVTEALDSNHLLGRPNQYISAAWITDSGATAGETGIDGGAVVEVFANEADAKARSEYILGVLKEMGPAYGTEWHHLKGAVLLRVSGKLTPTVNKQYTAAFGS